MNPTSSASSDFYYQSAEGLSLYCRLYAAAEQPAGLPVLCLPGLTRNSRDFAALAEHLRPRHAVLAADLRGRGRSAWDTDPSRYHIGTYVRDAWSLLDARAVRRVVVIGTSLGALMGMAMAAAQPQRIAGVVLNDAGPEIDPVGWRRIIGYAGKLPPVSSWAEAIAQTRSIYGPALPGLDDSAWLDFARRGYRENDKGVPVPDVDPKIRAVIEQAPATPADTWPLYAAIKGVPMLVIRGALSDLLSEATVRRMVREKPGVEQVTVANRGHTPLLDEPEALEAIDAFMARHASGRDPEMPAAGG